MIDRQGNRIIIECDTCNATFEGEEGDEWAAIWASAKREGWKSRQVAGEWLHFCDSPRCKP